MHMFAREKNTKPGCKPSTHPICMMLHEIDHDVGPGLIANDHASVPYTGEKKT